METKAWYKSKTLWGAVIMALSAILSQTTGQQISADEQETATHMVMGIAEGAGALVGFILVIVGRIKATRTLKAR